MERDLFNDVSLSVGCVYVSDLRREPYRSGARQMIKSYIEIDEYSLKSLSEMYEYLYGTHKEFSSHAEAKAAFKATR